MVSKRGSGERAADADVEDGGVMEDDKGCEGDAEVVKSARAGHGEDCGECLSIGLKVSRGRKWYGNVRKGMLAMSLCLSGRSTVDGSWSRILVMQVAETGNIDSVEVS